MDQRLEPVKGFPIDGDIEHGILRVDHGFPSGFEVGQYAGPVRIDPFRQISEEKELLDAVYLFRHPVGLGEARSKAQAYETVT